MTRDHPVKVTTDPYGVLKPLLDTIEEQMRIIRREIKRDRDAR